MDGAIYSFENQSVMIKALVMRFRNSEKDDLKKM